MIDEPSSNQEAIASQPPFGVPSQVNSEADQGNFGSQAEIERPRAQRSQSRYSLVERSPLELVPHSLLARHNIEPSTSRLSAVAESFESLPLDPIFITRDNKILKGLEEWKFASVRKIEKVLCLVYDLDQEGSIRWILEHNRKSEYLNDLLRIEVALELKPILRERAQNHVQSGGALKGSMNLSKSERIDCRNKIAAAARVADSQVSKVEKLLENSNPEFLEALRSGEIKINRAFCWLRQGKSLTDELANHRSQCGLPKAINLLLRRHLRKPQAVEGITDVHRIGIALAAMDPVHRANVVVVPIRVPGQLLLLSEQLWHNLQRQGELHYEPD
jgi:hypothetical protein